MGQRQSATSSTIPREEKFYVWRNGKGYYYTQKVDEVVSTVKNPSKSPQPVQRIPEPKKTIEPSRIPFCCGCPAKPPPKLIAKQMDCSSVFFPVGPSWRGKKGPQKNGAGRGRQFGTNYGNELSRCSAATSVVLTVTQSISVTSECATGSIADSRQPRGRSPSSVYLRGYREPKHEQSNGLTSRSKSRKGGCNCGGNRRDLRSEELQKKNCNLEVPRRRQRQRRSLSNSRRERYNTSMPITKCSPRGPSASHRNKKKQPQTEPIPKIIEYYEENYSSCAYVSGSSVYSAMPPTMGGNRSPTANLPSTRNANKHEMSAPRYPTFRVHTPNASGELSRPFHTSEKKKKSNEVSHVDVQQILSQPCTCRAPVSCGPSSAACSKCYGLLMFIQYLLKYSDSCKNPADSFAKNPTDNYVDHSLKNCETRETQCEQPNGYNVGEKNRSTVVPCVGTKSHDIRKIVDTNDSHWAGGPLRAVASAEENLMTLQGYDMDSALTTGSGIAWRNQEHSKKKKSTNRICSVAATAMTPQPEGGSKAPQPRYPRRSNVYTGSLLLRP